MRRTPSPHAEMVLTVLFWGGNFTASKIALAAIPPLPFTAIRFGLGTILLWLLLNRIEPNHSLPRTLLWPVIILGLIGNTLYQLCFITGLASTTATNTSLILTAMPTVVTVVAGAMGLEVVTPRQRWALAFATIGVLVVILAGRGARLDFSSRVGDLLILLAVLCWTGYTIGLRRWRGDLSPIAITAWALATGTPGLVLAGLPGMLALNWSAVPGKAWAGLCYSLLLSLVAAYVLWTRSVQRLGAARASLYTCATPLVAIVIASAVLGERPTLAHLLGGGLIIGGVVLGNATLRQDLPAEG